MAAGLVVAARHIAQPKVVLLLPEAGAQWITVDEPFILLARKPERMAAGFRVEFEASATAEPAVLTVRALRAASVTLDEKPLPSAVEPENWKQPYRFDLPAGLTQGKHTLEFVVSNDAGPCVLLAFCKSLDLRSASTWQARRGKDAWRPALLADTPRRAERTSFRFPTAAQGLARHALLLAVIFSGVFWFSRHPPARPSAARWVSLARGAVMIGWAALAVDGFWKIPTDDGYDAPGHKFYVEYIVAHRQLPLATDGWQTFQSPLYYLLLAPLFSLLTHLPGVNLDLCWRLLRLSAYICGALAGEVSFRAVRRLWPQRFDLQAIGTLFGGLVPMNLYACQAVGNEPAAALATGCTVLLALRMLIDRSETSDAAASALRHELRDAALLGLAFGLALLAKFTAVLLGPLVAIAVAWHFRSTSPRRTIRALAVMLGTAALVAGWYYVRNWVYLGKPFVGGWSDERGIDWWQDPGYRTPAQFYRFGAALGYPIYAGTVGFWDGLYASFWIDSGLSSKLYAGRPPWNYDFVVAGAWLGLVPTSLMAIGVWRAAWGSAGEATTGLRWCAACVLLYLAAIMGLFLDLPIYSTVKATYSLGLIPCYAALLACGIDACGRISPFARALLYGALAVWGVTAYVAYFAV